MKTFRLLGIALFAIFVCMNFNSCDDELYVPENLVGNWSGKYHDDRGTAYLNVDFFSDSSGELYLESPTEAFTQVYFNFSVSDNIVKCKGAYASTMGDVGVGKDFSITFQLKDDCLIPIDKYEWFILTQNGSIETNMNGDIVKDQSKELQGVWVRSSGNTVFYINDSKNAVEYTLYEPESNKYTWVSSFQYDYDYKLNELNLYTKADAMYFTITTLNSDSLIFKDKKTKGIHEFKRGTISDIPTEFIKTW